MKIIFLDIDGILTYQNYNNPDTASIDTEKVELLKEICDKTTAKIVISSSWKKAKKETQYATLRKILSEHNIEVLGDTPDIPAKLSDKQSKTMTLNSIEKSICRHGTGRAAEIEKWINEHDVENFVILDDENWDWTEYNYENHWIQPSWFGNGGLKTEHVEQAIAMLNQTKGEPP